MTITTTRRAAIAGALASAGLPPVAKAGTPAHPPAIIKAKQVVVRRGRGLAATADGSRLVVVRDGLREIDIVESTRTRAVAVGGFPLEVALSPDGLLAAVTTGFWERPALVLVDLVAAKVVGRAECGPAPGAVAWNGGRIVVAGGEQDGTLTVLEAATLNVVATHTIGRVPRGLALPWVALNGADEIVEVDLARGLIGRSLRVPRLPHELALSADGKTLLVTHGGREAHRVSEVETESGAVRRQLAGRLPSAVAWSARGAGLVALGGAAEVLDMSTGRTTAVGGAPRGLAVAGSRAFTVSQLTGAISEVAA